jgi:hypothetical protein
MEVVSEDHDRLYCVEQVFTKYENNKPAKLLLQLCLVMVSILLEYHAVCTELHISIDSCTGSLIKQVFERPVDVEELLAADEVFCTGTAVVVNPVGSITYESRRIKYNGGEVGEVAKELYEALTNIQMGQAEDKMGWIVELN